MNSQQVFITGATGILGSWVLAEVVAHGHQPVVLMRDATVEQARRRLDQALSVTHCPHGAKDAQILLGDVSRPQFGLSSQALGALRRDCGAFIHCAASVSFDPTRDDATLRTNVQGTGHVLEVLADTGIPLYHVSTAYVAGKATGLWRENDLERGQDFNNAYERSKCESEAMVHQAFASGDYCGAVFRPAIIVGAAKTGRIAQFLNFYGFIRLMEAAFEQRLHQGGAIRLPMNPLCTKNFVPVDWTAQALWRILEREGASGKVYNLTHPQPVVLQEMLAWANHRLQGSGITFEHGVLNGKKGTPIERVAQLQLRHYLPYLQEEPLFDRTNTDQALNGALPFPATDMKFFDRLYDYASAQGWRSVFQEPASNGKSVERRQALVNAVAGSAG